MRYGWLGSTRKRLVCDLVSRSTTAWLQDWCLQPAVIEIDVSEHTDALWRPDSCLIWTVKVGAGCFFVAMRREQLDSLGKRLVLSMDKENDDMSYDLARAALEGLTEVLARKAGQMASASAERWEAPWPESVCRTEWGALGLRIALDDVDVMVAMDRVVVDTIAPGSAGKPVSLTSRLEALGNVQVPLSAVLDFGSVAANELADLQIGEVLISENPVGQQIAVQTGNRHLFDANLAHSAGHLAAVASIPNNEGVS